MLQDVRLALRRMRRNPLFAISAAGTLAVGVAATTSIYSVVDGVLLKPLPFPDATSLVRVTSDYQALGMRDIGLSQPELDDFRRAGVFESIAGIWPISANLTGSERPERVEVLLTGSNYFDILGARAAVGRTFSTGDEIPGIATVAVISDGLWRRGFGADPRIVGRTLRIDEDVYEVIGVMPPTFRHPSVTLETDVEVWAPAGWKASPFPPPGYSARFVASAIGRLAPGVTAQDGGARLERLAKSLASEHPDDYPARLGWTPKVRPLAADLVANVRPALLLLMAAIVCVLLIAVSNISNLLLVRAVEREREVAIQRALGASRARVISEPARRRRRPGIRRRRGRLPCEPLGRRPAPSARAGATAARDRHRHRSPRLSVRARDFARRRASRRPGTGAAVRPRGRHRTVESGRPQRRRRRSRAGPQCAGRSPGRRRLHPAVRSRASRPQPLERGVGGHRHANRQAPDYPSVAAAAERSRVGPVRRPRQARRSDANHPGPPDTIRRYRCGRHHDGAARDERQRYGVVRSRGLDAGPSGSRGCHTGIGDARLLPCTGSPARLRATAAGFRRHSRGPGGGGERNVRTHLPGRGHPGRPALPFRRAARAGPRAGSLDHNRRRRSRRHGRWPGRARPAADLSVALAGLDSGTWTGRPRPEYNTASQPGAGGGTGRRSRSADLRSAERQPACRSAVVTTAVRNSSDQRVRGSRRCSSQPSGSTA